MNGYEDATITNTVTGQSYYSNISGGGESIFNADGSIDLILHGPSLWIPGSISILPPGTPAAFFFMGHLVIHITNPGTNLEVDNYLSIKGKVTDICPLIGAQDIL